MPGQLDSGRQSVPVGANDTLAAVHAPDGPAPERTHVTSVTQFLRGCVAYREALDRELPHAAVEDAEYSGLAASMLAGDDLGQLGQRILEVLRGHYVR